MSYYTDSYWQELIIEARANVAARESIKYQEMTMSITQAQIQAVGDQVINWAKSKFGSAPFATVIANAIQTQWDSTGVAEVAKVLGDLGWTVSS